MMILVEVPSEHAIHIKKDDKNEFPDHINWDGTAYVYGTWVNTRNVAVYYKEGYFDE